MTKRNTNFLLNMLVYITGIQIPRQATRVSSNSQRRQKINVVKLKLMIFLKISLKLNVCSEHTHEWVYRKHNILFAKDSASIYYELSKISFEVLI